MWNASQGNGGFMADSLSSPSVQGSGKGKKAQNIVPIKVSEVLEAPEEGFKIEGHEVGLVTLVGKVMSVNRSATKSVYEIKDESGTVEVIQWVDENAKEKDVLENSYVKVVGSIRTQGDKKHVMALRISDVPSQAEIDYHILDIVYTHLKLKQLYAKQTGQVGFGDQSGLSNSMMGGNFGSGGMMNGGNTTSNSSSGMSFGHSHYDLVYSIIKGSMDDEGIDITTIPSMVKNKMTKAEVDQAIEFLSSDGHIYTTVDEDHYKVTDAD